MGNHRCHWLSSYPWWTCNCWERPEHCLLRRHLASSSRFDHGRLCKEGKLRTSEHLPLFERHITASDPKTSRKRDVAHIHLNYSSQNLPLHLRRRGVSDARLFRRWCKRLTTSQHFRINPVNQRSLPSMDDQSHGPIIPASGPIVDYGLQNLFRWYVHSRLPLWCHQFRHYSQPEYRYQGKIQNYWRLSQVRRVLEQLG